jgi:predicted enzyme related to lactoylglutathione lyase
MSERTHHEPGAFCFAELSTDDSQAATSFYVQLFGWNASYDPVGDGRYYTDLSVGDKQVAEITPRDLREQELARPAVWNSFVTVEDVDAMLERSSKLGWTVLEPAVDVSTAGRLATIQDPHGASIAIWEPRRHIGSSLVNEPGAPCWYELASPDPEASSAYYGELFGWTTEPDHAGRDRCLTVKNGDRIQGSIRPSEPGDPAAFWRLYFGVSDVEAALAQARALGAVKVVGPMSMGTATTGMVEDPQGAWFGLYAGRFEP